MEIVAPAEVVNDGSWPGSRTRLVDASMRGEFCFEVSDAATLRFYGGVQRLEAGASMSGEGRVQVSGGTLDLNAGSYTIEEFLVDALSAVVLGTLSVDTDLSLPRLLHASGGTLTGTGTLTLTGLGSQWTGGVMTGGGTTKIAVGAELTVGGTSRKNLGNRTIQNEGPSAQTLERLARARVEVAPGRIVGLTLAGTRSTK